MYAFTASSYRAISKADDATTGEQVAQEVPESVLDAITLAVHRTRRNDLLRNCDWTQVADAPLSIMEKGQWATYRQALRDLPTAPGFPDAPWPVPPTLPAGAAHED